ncbi:hypothetical protein [Pelagibius sp. Alg239-R121]|uniref:hypothetical protein n=1 Tax=Pelagibius sp. Alg239-R121 TaxID=2993448 RepID=UPI0024A6DD1B|nr:hypothetical protein [Pelagibius sp. Alg239-R121]
MSGSTVRTIPLATLPRNPEIRALQDVEDKLDVLLRGLQSAFQLLAKMPEGERNALIEFSKIAEKVLDFSDFLAKVDGLVAELDNHIKAQIQSAKFRNNEIDALTESIIGVAMALLLAVKDSVAGILALVGPVVGWTIDTRVAIDDIVSAKSWEAAKNLTNELIKENVETVKMIAESIITPFLQVPQKSREGLAHAQKGRYYEASVTITETAILLVGALKAILSFAKKGSNMLSRGQSRRRDMSAKTSQRDRGLEDSKVETSRKTPRGIPPVRRRLGSKTGAMKKKSRMTAAERRKHLRDAVVAKMTRSTRSIVHRIDANFATGAGRGGKLNRVKLRRKEIKTLDDLIRRGGLDIFRKKVTANVLNTFSSDDLAQRAGVVRALKGEILELAIRDTRRFRKILQKSSLIKNKIESKLGRRLGPVKVSKSADTINGKLKLEELSDGLVHTVDEANNKIFLFHIVEAKSNSVFHDLTRPKKRNRKASEDVNKGKDPEARRELLPSEEYIELFPQQMEKTLGRLETGGIEVDGTAYSSGDIYFVDQYGNFAPITQIQPRIATNWTLVGPDDLSQKIVAATKRRLEERSSKVVILKGPFRNGALESIVEAILEIISDARSS